MTNDHKKQTRCGFDNKLLWIESQKTIKKQPIKCQTFNHARAGVGAEKRSGNARSTLASYNARYSAIKQTGSLRPQKNNTKGKFGTWPLSREGDGDQEEGMRRPGIVDALRSFVFIPAENSTYCSTPLHLSNAN